MPLGIYPHKPNQGFQKGHKGFRTKESYQDPTYREKIKKNRIKLTGRKLSLRHIENIVKAKTGIPCPLSTRKKISIANSGENHYRWNLDRELAKHNLRNDGEYKQWVKKVKERDSNICKLKDENCLGYNIVHHILDWSAYPKLRYKINNGITLCQFHHPRKRADGKRLIPVFQELVEVK